MTATILGTLTIGQAPRPDVTPILDQYIPESLARIHRGLLDGLSRDQIAGAYAAKPGDAVLVTRLSGGSSVELSAQKVHRALQARLDALEEEGCNIVLLLCTGAFEGLHLRRGFLLESAIFAILPLGTRRRSPSQIDCPASRRTAHLVAIEGEADTCRDLGRHTQRSLLTLTDMGLAQPSLVVTTILV
jgi:AroM protein